MHDELASRGFTVLELMVALSLGGILLAVGIPSLIELKASSLRYEGKLQLEAAVKRARAEAVAQGARSILRFDADGSGYSLGVDYLPYSPSAAEDIVISFESLPKGVSAMLGSEAIFSSSGMLINRDGDAGAFKFRLSYHGKEYCHGAVFSTGLVQLLC